MLRFGIGFRIKLLDKSYLRWSAELLALENIGILISNTKIETEKGFGSSEIKRLRKPYQTLKKLYIVKYTTHTVLFSLLSRLLVIPGYRSVPRSQYGWHRMLVSGQVLSGRHYRGDNPGNYTASLLPTSKAGYSVYEYLLSPRGIRAPRFLCSSGSGSWLIIILLYGKNVSLVTVVCTVHKSNESC